MSEIGNSLIELDQCRSTGGNGTVDHATKSEELGTSNRLTIQGYIWKEIGGLYPFLDLPSGVCFVIGSIFFTLAPALELADVEMSNNPFFWMYTAGVALFTVAKLFAESRALYAHYFKAPDARVGMSYHAAVAGLLIGGMLFQVDLVLDLLDQSEVGVGACSMSSSLFFLAGSFGFVLDAIPECHEDKWLCKTSNTYIIGSLLYLVGSFSFVIGSSYQIAGDKVSMNIGNLIGGAMFLLGSICFLALGFWEMNLFPAGPDRHLSQVKRRMGRLGML